MSMYDIGFGVCQELRIALRVFVEEFEKVFLYVSSWGEDYFEITFKSRGDLDGVVINCESLAEFLEDYSEVYDVSLKKDDLTGFHELPVRVCFSVGGG